MSNDLNSTETLIFDSADNIREIIDWVASGDQARILTDFYNSKAVFGLQPYIPSTRTYRTGLRGFVPNSGTNA
jgi:hypothetical protein